MKYFALAGLLGILLIISACSSTETYKPNPFFYNTTVLCSFVGQGDYVTNETISTDTSEKALTEHFSNSLKWTSKNMYYSYDKLAPQQFICHNENLNFACNFGTNGNTWDCKHIYDWSQCNMELAEEIPVSEQIYRLDNINGKLVYATREDNCSFSELRGDTCGVQTKLYSTSLYSDSEKIGEYSGLIDLIQEFQGKLLYLVRDRGIVTLYIDNKKISQYNYIHYITELDGKLVYVASRDYRCTHRTCSGSFFIVKDGIESEEKFEQINFMTNIGDKLAYVKLNGLNYYVVCGDKEYGSYKSVGELVDLNGDVAYLADQTIFINGEPIKLSEDIDHIQGRVLNFNGKLVYGTIEKNQTYVRIGDEKHRGTPPFYLVDGKLVYFDYKDGYHYIIHGDKEYRVGKESPLLHDTLDHTFIYQIPKNGERFYFYEGCQLPGNIYGSFTEIHNNLAYVVTEDDKYLIKIYSVLK